MNKSEAWELFVADVAERVVAKLRDVSQPPKPTETPDAPVPKAEAARLLGIHQSTLDRAVKAGCPVVHFNGRRRFDVPAVRAWFASERSKTADGRDDTTNVDHITKRMNLKRVK